MSIISNLRSRKNLPFAMLLFTLAIGILIGTLIDSDVKAGKSQAAPDATPLAIPSPVELQNEFSKLAKQLGPTVVNITTDYIPDPQEASRGGSEEEMELFRRFFGDQAPPQRPSRRSATGSGFIVDPKGYIITNHHVVEKADAIKVKLMDDQSEHKAKLIGFDVETDLAVIKIDAGRPLKAIEIGNSDAVQVGDWAVAIGSPFGLESTVTAGIVSAKGRDIGAQQFQRFIQTDAAINRGNSGGPLVNIRGEVIGVNTMIATSSGGYQGVGFALPTNTAVKVYNQVIQHGRVTRGSIGISFGRNEDPDLLPALGVDHGVVVATVPPGGPADKAGVKADDIITEINGKPIASGDELVAKVADTPVGDMLTLSVDRGGERLDIDVVVGDRSEVWRDDPRFSHFREEDAAEPNDEVEARFGMHVKNITPREMEERKLDFEGAVIVTRVEVGSFADDIGLRENDVVISINRQPVTSVEDLKKLQTGLSSGDPVAFRVARGIPIGRDRGLEWRTTYVAGKLP
jgi:serine protease Do